MTDTMTAGSGPTGRQRCTLPRWMTTSPGSSTVVSKAEPAGSVGSASSSRPDSKHIDVDGRGRVDSSGSGVVAGREFNPSKGDPAADRLERPGAFIITALLDVAQRTAGLPQVVQAHRIGDHRGRRTDLGDA